MDTDVLVSMHIDCHVILLIALFLGWTSLNLAIILPPSDTIVLVYNDILAAYDNDNELAIYNNTITTDILTTPEVSLDPPLSLLLIIILLYLKF